MNLRDLEAYVAVVETGSIIGASARLNLTQPGVTRRIQNLEDGLGAVLLDRQSKPLRPTNAGREAYEQGLRVLPLGVEELDLRRNIGVISREGAYLSPLAQRLTVLLREHSR